MLYPTTFEQKLGFDMIRQILGNYCLSSLGRSRVSKIAFSTDTTEIITWHYQTAEMRQILQFEENFPSQDYYDLIPELLRVRIPNTYMETEQLSQLRLSVLTIQSLLLFFSERREKFPTLYEMMAGKGFSSSPDNSDYDPARDTSGYSLENVFPILEGLVDHVNRIVDEKSEIRDTASPELNRIRKQKISLQAAVERKVIQSYKLARQSGWTPDDAEITVRNGRLVIPMISAHKRKIQGFMHDESATGQTVYIEPAEIFETNNEIRELDYAERREIIRILIAFTTSLRPDIDSLIHAYNFLGQVDFIRAKARFAISIGATSLIHPHPNAAAFMWHQAIHPLLFLSHQKQNKNIVPLNIGLNSDNRILIISGPNAGGKSVCLKTVGLVQYMFQCGLLPPVREDSEFTIFTRIFIDIGDEQSIDNDLSTYTSKLLNLKFFIENTNSSSLFLIDELGTGTDPSLGGTIAEASLEALNAKLAMGIVTTHYSNLKLLASREPGIINGAMLFDIKKLKPLYQLKVGKPGSSFALEIAHEIGFPEYVLKNAKNKTGKSQLDFDRELQNLEVEKQEINQKSTELKVADDFLAELIKKYEKQSADLESKKKEILDKAREEARQLLDGSNKIIEKTIKEIRESQADKTRTKIIRAELSEIKIKFSEEKQKPQNMSISAMVNTSNPENPNQPIIQHGSQKRDAGKTIIRSDMVGSAAPPHRFQSYFNDLHTKLTNYSLTLDIRGKRVDEALQLLQRYIDDAILLSIPEVQILHGKGNGVLRQVTRDYLRSQKEVKSARDAAMEQGGAGITVVYFR
jgi:DNA mismatch repair protein MutS2